MNGDGIFDNDLFYVPNVGEYVMADPSEAADFEEFLANSGLDRYRGQAPERNSFKAPRINLWDLKIKQELPEMGMFRASLFVSIKNLGNLLNDDWGQVYTGSFDGIDIAEIDGYTPEGLPIIDFEGSSDVISNLDQRNIENSRWQAQVGIRIEF